MMIFSEDTEIVRSSPVVIASYSASLLEEGKSKRMACSITSLVGLQVAAPVLLLSVEKRHPHSGYIGQSCLTSFPTKEPLLKSQPVPGPSLPDKAYIEYRTYSAQLPTEPCAPTD